MIFGCLLWASMYPFAKKNGETTPKIFSYAHGMVTMNGIMSPCRPLFCALRSIFITQSFHQLAAWKKINQDMMSTYLLPSHQTGVNVQFVTIFWKIHINVPMVTSFVSIALTQWWARETIVQYAKYRFLLKQWVKVCWEITLFQVWTHSVKVSKM